MKHIPVNSPLLSGNEVEYVMDAIKTGWISSNGKYIAQFEKCFSSYTNRKYSVTVNNGTSALILGLRAMNLPKGSEVILPSFTIISCALACIYNDLIPIFVDSDEDTWNMRVSEVEAAINSNTSAIMMVHTYGHPVEVNEILELAAKHNLRVIEDFAEAIGSEYMGKPCGSFGDISCASFYANKVITTGEGGMCSTNEEQADFQLRYLKNLAFGDPRYIHKELGHNFRMTNVQAAIGLAQIEKIENRVIRKVEIAKRYLRNLKPMSDAGRIFLPVEKSWAKNTYWMFGVKLNSSFGKTASEMMARLMEFGVETRNFFYPLHLQPAFEKFNWHKNNRLPVSEELYKYGFYLPSGLSLSDEEIDVVCQALEDVLK